MTKFYLKLIALTISLFGLSFLAQFIRAEASILEQKVSVNQLTETTALQKAIMSTAVEPAIIVIAAILLILLVRTLLYTKR